MAPEDIADPIAFQVGDRIGVAIRIGDGGRQNDGISAVIEIRESRQGSIARRSIDRETHREIRVGNQLAFIVVIATIAIIGVFGTARDDGDVFCGRGETPTHRGGIPRRAFIGDGTHIIPRGEAHGSERKESHGKDGQTRDKNEASLFFHFR